MAKLIEEQDIILVKSSIVLEVVLDVLTKNLKIIESTELSLHEVYILHAKTQVRDLELKSRQNRIDMRARGIKILSNSRGSDGIKVEYLCRGYKHKMHLLWELLKSETTIFLCESLNLDIEKLAEE